MNICDILLAHAATCPESPAIIEAQGDHSRTLTYADLERASARAAALLYRTGLREGDGVLALLPMSAELYIGLAAIFRLGLVAMFPDPSAGKAHIEFCCALHPPKAMIATSRAHLLRILSPAIQQIPLKFSVGLPVPGATSWSRADRLDPFEQIHPSRSDTPALLTFTSGSTGRPKAAVRTHGFLLAQHRVLELSLGLKPGEVDLTALPMFVLANLASGVTSLIPDVDLRHPASIDSAALVSQIQAHQPTRIVASPALLEGLTEYCLEHGVTLSGFRKIFMGGAPVFPRLLAKLRSVAPQANLTAVYGSTEAEPIAHVGHEAISPEDIDAMLAGRGLIAGTPVSTIQLRILPDRWGTPVGPFSRKEFASVSLSPGEVGEIVVSGEHVLSGYLRGVGDEETKFTVAGTPWHRTGDEGYLDERGRLWLLGRCAARIEDAYGTLYPFTVECAAHEHPGVRRAAMISRNGRRILAIEPDGSPRDLDLTSLRQRLAWAHIDEIQMHERIPVDQRHNAKIDYPALHQMLDATDRLSYSDRRLARFIREVTRHPHRVPFGCSLPSRERARNIPSPLVREGPRRIPSPLVGGRGTG